jgi:hypothetical protein
MAQGPPPGDGFVAVDASVDVFRADGCGVVALHGLFDAPTAGALAAALARAIAGDGDDDGDDVDVVLDLGDAELDGAEVIVTVRHAQAVLARRSRALRVRAPSPAVRSALTAWGCGDLVERHLHLVPNGVDPTHGRPAAPSRPARAGGGAGGVRGAPRA